MCGITGVYYYNSDKLTDRDILNRMTDVIEHRGPDDRGTYIDKNVGMGFRRLSIIDLSEAGHQPMSNSDNSIWITFNGEIYNFLETRDHFLRSGHSFKSKTDTEVIIKLYEERGLDFVKELRGMFGLAIWNQKKRELIIARDRVGKKPVFYYDDGQKLIYGSEMKSILKHPDLILEYDYEAINEFFSFGYISAPKTIYKNVRKLQSGHILICKNGRISTEQYWNIDLQKCKPYESEQEAIEHLKFLINESVKIRMISDVPIGAFLSGGVDSSIVVAYMAMNSSKPVKTFSIGFNETDFNETQYARIIAKKFETDHYEETVNPDYSNILEEIICDFDEPFGDSSALPTYVVSKITRKHVTVALSGDGGDELFGGYRLYKTAINDLKFNNIPSIFRKPINFIADHYPDQLRGGHLLKRMGAENQQMRYIERFFSYNVREKQSLFSFDALRLLSIENSYSEKMKFFDESSNFDFINQMGYNDFKHYLPEDIMAKVDRMSMLNSLETRSPLLDHHIIEFAFRLNGSFKIKNNESKYILKKAMAGILPNEILYRKKMGFGVPVKHWFSNELSNYCFDLINSEEIRNSGLFNVKSLNRYLKIHKSGTRDMSVKLWFIVTFALFLKGQKKSLGMNSIR